MTETIFTHPMLMQNHLPFLKEDTKKNLPTPETINFAALKVACVLELVNCWFGDMKNVRSASINLDLALLTKALLTFDPKNGKHYINPRFKISQFIRREFGTNHPIWELLTMGKVDHCDETS